MRTFILPILLTALVVTGCSGPKALTKRGAELHGAGLGKQAAEMYFQALRKKPGYVDAMVGLRSSGQGVIDGWVGEFQQAAMDARRDDAIALYEDMTAYTQRIAKVNVDLLIPTSVTSDYKNLLDDHLIELDEQGHAQLEAEDFTGAEATFREMVRLDADYGDARALLIVAQAEPEYRRGQTGMQDGTYRAAYEAFGKVLGLDGEYKEAKSLQQEALDNGQFNLAIIGFESSRRHEDVALELRSGIQNGLISSNDPFIGIVDRTQREEIIAEQELSISGIADEQVEVGGLAGARAMLTGAILMYASETGSPISTTRQGFRKYFVEEKDEEGKTKKVAAYAPTRYTLHSQRREVTLKFELKLISTETSEVLFSKVEEVSAMDAVEYASSPVEAGLLYPARSNGEVDRSGKARMSSMLNARRELISESNLRNQVLAEATARGKRDIEQFLARHVK